MNTREVKAAFGPAGQVSAAVPDKLLERCREEYNSRPHRRRAGKWELVRSQLRFIALPVWALQGAVLALICLVLGAAAPDEELIPACASIAAEMAALTLLPFYNRAARYGMREIESAARFNSAHIMLARLVAVGIGDAVCISAIALLSGGAANEVLILVVTPFLLTGALSLAVLEHAGEAAVLLSAGMGAVLAVLYWTFAMRFTEGLLSLSPLVAAIICLAALAMLACECRAMLSESKLEKELGYES